MSVNKDLMQDKLHTFISALRQLSPPLDHSSDTNSNSPGHLSVSPFSVKQC